MRHVELVQNEWASGRQKIVARVTLNGTGRLRVEAEDVERWAAIALRPFVDPTTHEEIDPQTSPEQFLERLHAYLHGDYLFATTAHEEGDCEHPLGSHLEMQAHAHHASTNAPALH